MTVERNPGGTVITGAHIDIFRMMALRSALKLQLNTGLKFSWGSPYAVVKRQYGLKGSMAKVYAQFSAMVDLAKVQADIKEPPKAGLGTGAHQ